MRNSGFLLALSAAVLATSLGAAPPRRNERRPRQPPRVVPPLAPDGAPLSDLQSAPRIGVTVDRRGYTWIGLHSELKALPPQDLKRIWSLLLGLPGQESSVAVSLRELSTFLFAAGRRYEKLRRARGMPARVDRYGTKRLRLRVLLYAPSDASVVHLSYVRLIAGETGFSGVDIAVRKPIPSSAEKAGSAAAKPDDTKTAMAVLQLPEPNWAALVGAGERFLKIQVRVREGDGNTRRLAYTADGRKMASLKELGGHVRSVLAAARRQPGTPVNVFVTVSPKLNAQDLVTVLGTILRCGAARAGWNVEGVPIPDGPARERIRVLVPKKEGSGG